MNHPIVSAEWLSKNINKSDLIILDASQHIENTKRIKGARYFDLKNKFSDQNSPYPNTFPTSRQFQKEGRKLGIDNDSHMVVYDNKGIYTSPRVWWMFRAMGHTNVSVLDGGLPEWINAGFETEDHTAPTYKAGNFTADFQTGFVKDITTVATNISTKKEIVVDARSRGRFQGTAPEPRKGLRSGHIPGSINIPYTEVLENGKFKSNEALQPVFSQLEESDNPLIFSCGSGVTACIVLLAAEQVLGNPTSIYDGSWTEWASEKT